MQDTLSELLQTIRVESTCCLRAELTAPWGCRHEPSTAALFYICVGGTIYLEIAAANQVAVLQPGDCAIIPHGSAHTLKDSLSSPARLGRPAPCAAGPMGLPIIRAGGGGGMATLFAIELRLDRARAKTLMRFLPDLIHVPGDNGQLPTWARPLAEAGYIEIENRGPGSQAVLNRVGEMLFIQAIRSAAQKHARETEHHMGKVRWSPQVFNAVRLIRGELAQRWSVAELASRVGMSRSAFAAAFTREMEAPPMQYLAAQRMLRAAELLATPDNAIPEIAFLIGYDSDVAFTRGFKRHYGVGPGAYRRSMLLKMVSEPAVERLSRQPNEISGPPRSAMQRSRSA
jgi:AraC-like DNA-binding protein